MGSARRLLHVGPHFLMLEHPGRRRLVRIAHGVGQLGVVGETEPSLPGQFLIIDVLEPKLHVVVVAARRADAVAANAAAPIAPQQVENYENEHRAENDRDANANVGPVLLQIVNLRRRRMYDVIVVVVVENVVRVECLQSGRGRLE